MTASSGAAGKSANVTVTPPRVVEKGMVAAVASLLTNPVPKIDTRPPGDTGCPFAKLAPFRTPPSTTVGVCAEQTAMPREAAIRSNEYFISVLVTSYASILRRARPADGERFVKTLQFPDLCHRPDRPRDPPRPALPSTVLKAVV